MKMFVDGESHFFSIVFIGPTHRKKFASQSWLRLS